MSRTYPPAITGSADDPEFRRKRGRLGAAKTNSADGLIRRLEKLAPELTEGNRAALRALAAGASGGEAK